MKKILLLDKDIECFRRLEVFIKDAQIDHMTTQEDLWDKVKYAEFDMIIADLDMTKEADIYFLSLLKTVHPDKPVIIYTASFSMDMLRTAMKHRANNYLLKTSESQDTVDAIERAGYYEQYRMAYTLAEKMDLRAIEDSAGKLAAEAAVKYWEQAGDKEIVEFSAEDVFRIFTGSYQYKVQGKVTTTIGTQTLNLQESTRNKLLLVDDDNMLRSLLSLTLRKAFKKNGIDIEIIEAVNAEDGISAFSREKSSIAACVIDMRMPVSSETSSENNYKQSAGLEVLRQIRTFDPRCECVMLTAYAFTNELCECYRLGAYELCDKDDKEFFLDNILSAYQKAQTNFEQYSNEDYTQLLLFRELFAAKFSIELLSIAEQTRQLSDLERLNVIEFLSLMRKAV